MRVTMKGNISGLRNGVPWPERGESIDLPDDEAASLIASGIATEADGEQSAPEQEIAEPGGEQAVTEPAKKPYRARSKKAAAKTDDD